MFLARKFWLINWTVNLNYIPGKQTHSMSLISVIQWSFSPNLINMGDPAEIYWLLMGSHGLAHPSSHPKLPLHGNSSSRCFWHRNTNMYMYIDHDEDRNYICSKVFSSEWMNECYAIEWGYNISNSNVTRTPRDYCSAPGSINIAGTIYAPLSKVVGLVLYPGVISCTCLVAACSMVHTLVFCSWSWSWREQM